LVSADSAAPDGQYNHIRQFGVDCKMHCRSGALFVIEFRLNQPFCCFDDIIKLNELDLHRNAILKILQIFPKTTQELHANITRAMSQASTDIIQRNCSNEGKGENSPDWQPPNSIHRYHTEAK
jgi:hypothetical protein